ncbi:GlxA family transcriptional regulator [Pleomorphomonas sp. NRK KF1]|uniref:GlxA family transcriptional regulator n=1 Tax=Pleomorphomonas sp. NRK KF1 TaxID=2943000 RepID=UPI00204415EE|nr:GlxA family transcriptional regulator [Pleomorphomonas sp. NRK KF1]MCM5552076.1 GlxA family transcriptional regulator [Pleomorphomonas sp. NRK KF1]
MTKNIGIFLYKDFQLLDASGPITAFEIAARVKPDAYRLALLSIKGGLVESSSGAAMDSLPVSDAPPLDTLVISGGNGSRDVMRYPETIAFLRACAANVRRMCSVCSGAFPLAAAGLLDGKRVTTHWRRAEQLQQLFPSVRVEVDRIHIRADNMWTSAGISAGIDLALALIADDLGEEVARRVAQEMVVYYRRPGGQSQFSALADLGGGDTRFSPLLEWMRANLAERLTVEQLAERMAMSPRNFSRAFLKVIGISPAKAVERLRVEAARERIESSREPIEQIATAVGFHDPERMRRAFLRRFGQPPQAIRRSQG